MIKPELQKISTRLQSVDSFRGFAIIAMVLVNFIAYFKVTPLFLRHAQGNVMTFADLVAPLFLFALGMMYRKSIIRRISIDGRAVSYFHVARRYSILLGIGITGGSIAKMQLSLDWGILQAIGLAGIISLPFIELALRHRVAAVVTLFFFYQWIILSYWGNQIQQAEHGGPLATISWATIILMASIAGDLLKPKALMQSHKNILLFCVVCITIGFSMQLSIPVSKSYVSSSYVMISTGLSGLVYLFFLILNDKMNIPTSLLQSLGRNALLIFLVHYILILLSHKLMRSYSNLLSVIGGVFLMFFACTLLAWILDKKQLYLKI